MKKKKNTAPNRKKRRWLIVWGIVAAAAAGFMLFAACDMAARNEGLSTPALTVCISVLFFLISIMVNQKCPQVKNWSDALFFTLAAEAAAELILLPILGKMIQISEIVLFLLTAAAAGALFWKRRKSGLAENLRIPLFLGLLGAGTGIFMMNTIAYMIFSGGEPSRLWLAIFFAGIFILLGISSAENALGRASGRSPFYCLAAAFIVQLAALLYTFTGYFADNLLVFQEIAAGVLFIAALIAFFVMRSKQKSGKPRG